MTRRPRSIATVCLSGTLPDKLEAAPDRQMLTAVNHVAQALPAGQMDGAVLFWRAVFGLEAQPLVNIPDLFGPVRSRAMVSADQTVRLPLNISEGRETLTGRFVSAYARAGMHRVAFATPDAAGAVAAAVEARARVLPIPGNDYDDLAASRGLDDPALDVLRRLHLLHDRDGGGEVVHAYADAFEERSFFEIAERRGSRGFGAATATVRMAAQAPLAATGATWMD